ncbi:MAG TPA: threonine/serine dehydratase [Micromonosporaceae bacterium]
MAELVTLAEIRRAAANLVGVAVRTPLVRPLVWPGLWLKPESLQPIGAFKIRGAAHALAMLPAEQRDAGVVTHSSGNHGQALAFAARRFGVPCVVVMPELASKTKVDAVRALGGEVQIVPVAERDQRCQEIAEQRGMTMIPPFDHPDVIAGQGTVGLEIVDEVPDLAGVLVPIGGGGLASGVATAVKAIRPDVPVIGVEPEWAGDAEQSLREGHLAAWPAEQLQRTVADGLRTNLSELTFAHLRERLDGVVTVTEAEIRASAGALIRSARLVVEPSGAVAPAAWLHRHEQVRHRFGLGEGPVVAVISGGNLDPALLAELAQATDLVQADEDQPGEAAAG